MKNLAVLLAWLMLAATIAADEKMPSAEETAIRKVLDDQVAAWNKGDLPGFMTGYWKSKELTFYSGKDKQQGWDQAFERYRKRYQSEGKEMGQLSFSELVIQKLSNESAIVKGRWKVEMKNETPSGLSTLIMMVKDQRWVIVHDHTSN